MTEINNENFNLDNINDCQIVLDNVVEEANQILINCKPDKKARNKFDNADARKLHYKDTKYSTAYYKSNIKFLTCGVCNAVINSRAMKKHQASVKCSFIKIKKQLADAVLEVINIDDIIIDVQEEIPLDD